MKNRKKFHLVISLTFVAIAINSIESSSKQLSPSIHSNRIIIYDPLYDDITLRPDHCGILNKGAFDVYWFSVNVTPGGESLFSRPSPQPVGGRSIESGPRACSAGAPFVGAPDRASGLWPPTGSCCWLAWVMKQLWPDALAAGADAASLGPVQACDHVLPRSPCRGPRVCLRA